MPDSNDMALGSTGADGRLHLVLPAALDLATATQLKARLEEALPADAGIDIDASAVQRAATPCLQVLAAAARSFREAGGPPLRICAPSAAFTEVVSVLALGAALGMEGK